MKTKKEIRAKLKELEKIKTTKTNGMELALHSLPIHILEWVLEE